MTDPSLALQSAIRAKLLASQLVMEILEPPNIRSGPTRPDVFPSIVLGDMQVKVDGHYGAYRNSTVFLDLHIWAADLDGAKTLGGAVSNALGSDLHVPSFDLTDGLKTERYLYMIDPSGCGHGVVHLSALMGYAL